MANFEDFEDALKIGVQKLVKDTLHEFEDEAKADADAFIEKLQDDLKRWTKLLAQKDRFNEEDFSDLINAKKALAEMFKLRQKGLGLIKLERFKKGLIDLILDTAFKVFL